jgi:hypothetical protein
MLFSTHAHCEGIWEGVLYMQLPKLQKGEFLWLDFIEPTRGRIKGLFVVQQQINMYLASKTGYAQRIWLEPKDSSLKGDQ